MDYLQMECLNPRYTSSSFLLTINQPERWEEVKDLLYSHDIKYIIACNEEAPTTGHKHIHCFVQFTRTVYLKKSKLLGINVKSVTNNAKNVVEYVKKDGNVFLEQGEFKGRGGRREPTNLPTIEEAANLTPEEISEYSCIHAKSIMYAKNIYSMLKAKEQRRFEPVKVHWLYGPTGTGKSRTAFEAGAYRITYRDGFFNDWGDAKILWLDDYRGEIPYNLLLQLLDGYRNSLIVNIKGGHKVVDIDEIYITSALSPADCYPRQTEKQDSIKQLIRRITETVYTGGPHVLDPRADLNKIEKICDENQFY